MFGLPTSSKLKDTFLALAAPKTSKWPPPCGLSYQLHVSPLCVGQVSVRQAKKGHKLLNDIPNTFLKQYLWLWMNTFGSVINQNPTQVTFSISIGNHDTSKALPASISL